VAHDIVSIQSYGVIVVIDSFNHAMGRTGEGGLGFWFNFNALVTIGKMSISGKAYKQVNEFYKLHNLKGFDSMPFGKNTLGFYMGTDIDQVLGLFYCSNTGRSTWGIGAGYKGFYRWAMLFPALYHHGFITKVSISF
jgi:hypothetical protein